MPCNVAPGVDSNRSTARRRNSSVELFLAILGFSLPQRPAGNSMSKIKGQAPFQEVILGAPKSVERAEGSSATSGTSATGRETRREYADQRRENAYHRPGSRQELAE